MDDRVIYVYGIVPAGTDAAAAPPGLDGASVMVEGDDLVAALVSTLDGTAYASETVETQAGDVAWVSPRAVAHDAVLSWASDAGAVIPLPMFTLFRDARGVREMLRERGAEFRRLLERVTTAQEFGVRVFRIDAELAEHVAELSSALAELERNARAATPGQRYLLERKVERERAAETRRVATDVARETYQSLEPLAVAGVRDPLVAREGDSGVAMLNASFLVRRDGLDAFRAALTALARRYEPLGFRFEFTGPWPPYHFVRDPA